MGFYTINKYYVYYDESKFKEVNEAYLNTLSPFQRIGINVVDGKGKPSEEALELEKLQYNFLSNQLLSLGADEFIKTWVRIEYNDAILIKREFWDLIYDNFLINGHGAIYDNQSEVEKLNRYLERDGHLYPYGRHPLIKFRLSRVRNKGILDLLTKSLKDEIFLDMHVDDIINVEGELNHLIIHFRNGTKVELGANVSIKI